METFLKQVQEMHEGGKLDPKMEVILKKINTIQTAREQTEEARQELENMRDAAEKELQKLCGEKVRLKEVLEKKQETLEILKLQRDNQLEKEKRQQEQTEEWKKRINDLTTKIQEEKLKQRKQRMEFQDQLEDLMAKHKALSEFYDSKRLEAEISQMEECKKELLQEESEKLIKLKEVEETETRLREQGVLTAENLFLRSGEAACAIKLFEEENKSVKTMLEKATACHTDLLNKYNRLKAEMEAAERNLSNPSDAPSNNPLCEGSRGARTSRSVLFPLRK